MNPLDYQWIFVLGIIFAFLDAYGIGANDVANSFATSVGSRSLTIGQACGIAIFTELGGAILLGAETAETVKNGIIQISLFKDIPEVLMLGFLCALVGSSFWVISASKWGFPVSTTHSIVGAIGGVGIAAFGTGSIAWDKVKDILISWIVSPGVAAVLASIIYLVTKHTVMKHPDSLERGLFAIPFYFMFSLSISAFYVVLKAPKGIDISKTVNQTPAKIGQALGITFGFGIVLVGLFCYVFLVPYLRRVLVKEEDLKLKHLLMPWVGEQPKNLNLNKRLALGADHSGLKLTEDFAVDSDAQTVDLEKNQAQGSETEDSEPKTFMEKFKAHPLVELATRGVTMDVASAQSHHVKGVHERAVRFDNKTEYLYSFLQVCTAAFASFAHGSNDVANAAGPLSAIVSIYNSGKIPASKVGIPFWILAFMGVAIDLGLVLYGYNIMRVLGNNITYHSPSRGFSMELGAALTVITASFLGLPVSTTHCITGATVGVGLCNGEFHAVNWKIVSWAAFSWVITLPVAGGIAGLLFKLLVSSPHL